MQPEALGDPLPDRGPLEEVKRPGAACDRVHRPRRQRLDARDDAVDAALMRPVDLVCESHDGDRQRDVGLDRGDTIVRVEGSPSSNSRRTRLRDSTSIGVDLERFEGGRQPAPMALVVMALTAAYGSVGLFSQLRP